MESLEFLSAILPRQGKYCVFTMRDKLRKNIFVDTLENLYETNTKLSEKGQNTFYALSTFDDEGTREAAHAQFIRSLFMDIDCGEGKAYPNKKAAVVAVHEFLVKSHLDQLGTPWLVDSGGGVHVYWPLEDDATIDEWRPVAEALKRCAKQHGLLIDMTVTADAARVLRMPGTLNWKYEPPRPVVLRGRGGVFDLEALAEILVPHTAPAAPKSSALMLAGQRPGGAVSTVGRALMNNSVTMFKNIMVRTVNGDGCGQVQYFIDHAKDDGMEPLWRGILSWTKVCDDGEKASRKISSLHPYDEERMQRKLDEIRGPYPCVKMDSENPGVCTKCRHWGRLTNPLVLGRELQTVTVATTVEMPQAAPQAPQQTYTRPEPPKGFEYGRHGGVFYRKPAEKEDEQDTMVSLTPYDFFMTRMFRDGSDYQAEFKVIKGPKIFTFAVPTGDLTAQKDCLKGLAKNNVLATTPYADPYLYQYVRQSIQQASAIGEEVVVPPRLGWQEDSSFALNDAVLSPYATDQDYAYVSDRLDNVIKATRSTGTYENWRKVMDMLRQKARGDSVVWGHLATAMMGFGSILMQFTPHGSRASVMHLCSKETGSGKSFAQALAVSVWGDPTRYLVAPSTTERTMMQRAGMLGSLPLCVDEITGKNRELNREWLPQFIFDFAAGMHKIKGSATGNNEVSHELMWNSIAIINSNTPGLEAMMGARKHTSEGEVRRYLEWQLPTGYRLSWTEEENRIRMLLSLNNGHAGPMFARWCVQHQAEVQHVMDEVRTHWVQTTMATDDERYWIAHAQSTIAACVLCSKNYANVVDIPAAPIMDFMFKLISRQREVINTNQLSSLDVLNAYTAENIGMFIRTEGSTVMQHLVGGQAVLPSSAKSVVRGRVEYNVVPGYVDYYIELRALKLHCADHSVGFTTFVNDLSAHGTVSQVRKNLLAGTKGPDMRVLCLKVSRPIEDVQP